MTRAGNFSVGGKVALLGIIVETYQAPVNNGPQQIPVQGLGSLGVAEPMSAVVRLLTGMGASVVLPTPPATATPAPTH
jgi:hypothetical protein